MTTYQGLQVLDIVTPNRGDGIQHEFLRPQNVLANAKGRQRFRARFAGQREGWAFDWICRTRAELRTMRAWIDTHRGAAIPFWLCSYARDLVIVEDAGVGAAALKIQPTEYTKQVFPNGFQRRHIAIWEQASVPARFRGITSAIETASYEQIGLDAVTGVSVTTSTILSYMLLVRLSEDEIEITHRGPLYAQAQIGLLEVPREAPEPV